MRGHSIVPLVAVACLLLPASKASADRIDVVGATTNMGAGFGSLLLNAVNGTGLSAPTLTATHAGTTPVNSWVSTPGIVTGHVDFDLGGRFSLSGFSFWNQNGGGPGAAGSTGINAVSVSYSTDGVAFFSLPGAPSSFAQVPSAGPVGPQMFTFPPVIASFVRFQIWSNHGDVNETGFAEVGFDGVSSTVIKTAVYDPGLKAPRCFSAAGLCDSGTLLVGRDTIPGGPEPNQPNTINNSCADGAGGTFHSDESIDRLKIATVDGSLLAPGKTARISATVFNFGGDFLDLYYAPDASSPSWTYITTVVPVAVGGLQTLSATYTVPPGGVQAVRANFRFGASASICTSGTFDDHDDLIFTTGLAVGDFDGDSKADPTVFRPSTGGWFILKSSTNYTTSTGVSWGLSTDVPVPGDYDGDGKTDPAIFRPSTGLWAMLKSSTGYGSSSYVFWGLSTDTAMPFDFDGDGKTDPAIFRPSTGLWAMLKSSTNYTSAIYVSWGP